MIEARRRAAAVLAVILVIVAAGPVAAQDPVVSGGGIETLNGRVSLYTDENGLHVVGQEDTDEFQSRLPRAHVVLVFRDAANEVVLSVNTPTMIDSAIRGTDIPWHVVVTDDVSAATTMESWTFFLNDGPTPVGGLDLAPASLNGLTATGTVRNDGTLTATDVVVYATLQSAFDHEGGHWLDTAASAPIPILAPEESAEYTIAFNPNAPSGGTVVEVVAETESGPYMTNWENFFADLIHARFGEEILWLAREGIVTGCNGGKFCPRTGVTRAQMATFLDRALELPDTHVDYFTDDEGHWAEDSINRMAEAGITDGCGEATFCPTGRVNRGQMAKFLVLAYELPPSSVDAFTDDETSTTEEYHNALAAAGVTNGCAMTFEQKYCPNRRLIRDEMAGFIYRAEHLEP